MRIKKISMIFPFDKSIYLQNTAHRVLMPRYGFMSITSTLNDNGYEVTAHCELSGDRVNWTKAYQADVVCISCFTFCAYKAYQYAKNVRKHSNATIIFGGPHASSLPAECLQYCDYVVRNEGEKTILELLNLLSNDLSVNNQKGISYIDTNKTIIHNPSNRFIKNITSYANPDHLGQAGKKNLFSSLKDILTNGIPRYNVAVSQASRGCPFACKFCNVKYELGSVYRTRSPDAVLDEIKHSLKSLKTKHLFFADNDFSCDRNHTLKILNLLYEKYQGDLDIFAFSRLSVAEDDEILHAFERAGRCSLALGIESTNGQALTDFNKGQTVSDVHHYLSLMQRYKIKIHGLFIAGADTDTPATIKDFIDTALRYNLHTITICSLYDIPTKETILGIPQILPDERFIHRDWRFYSGNFVVHYPLNCPPSVLQKEISQAYQRFYNASKDLTYQFHPIRITTEYYIEFLREAEKGMYDRFGKLREDLLPAKFAQEKHIDIKNPKIDVLKNLATFYFKNIPLKQAWKHLASMRSGK